MFSTVQVKLPHKKESRGFLCMQQFFLYKISNYLEIILLLQPFLRPLILIIIYVVTWPVTCIHTLRGCTFLFHRTIQWWSIPYFTLSKSSSSLYGFLYSVLHLFLSLLSHSEYIIYAKLSSIGYHICVESM
jgi:hypothetical protein